jgi:Zn-dependent peptidase ImmA (M78 family)
VKWTRDDTGRFRQRPHYLPDELESICDKAISGFLTEKYGQVRFPVTTSDITVLIEKAVDDFDNGCDLGDGIDGLTHFFPHKKPQVKISSRLHAPHLENRLRTTLTHEYGHVLLHGFLFALEADLRRLFDGKPRDTRNECHRESIDGHRTDWMEWQANFACGALLMPASTLTRVVREFRAAENLAFADIGLNSEAGNRLIRNVMACFQVSSDAARVRLEQRKIIVRDPPPGLFG